MEKELIQFIEKNNISAFSKPEIKSRKDTDIFKTRDAKSVNNKVLSKISSYFSLLATKSLLEHFNLTDSIAEIKKRQNFFKTIRNISDNSFLGQLKTPRETWSPKYDIIVVTENEKTFLNLKDIGCPVKYLTSEMDLEGLENADIIQVIDCEQFESVLESLPQAIFLKSESEVYLERYLELLSGWKNNLEILKNNESNDEIKRIAEELNGLLILTEEKSSKKITREEIENKLEEINSRVSEKMRTLTLSGEALFQMMSQKKIPKEIMDIIEQELNECGLPEDLFNIAVPLTIDEQESDKFLKKQSAEENTSVAEKIKKNAEKIKQVPQMLRQLEKQLILFDFSSGISRFTRDFSSFPEHSHEFSISESKNLLLGLGVDQIQSISFHLTEDNKCSILTGANSGGKTTLLEHIIQLISLFQLGLPVSGSIKLPLFTEIYYFAKNKGSTSKGAFETLLSQMSAIKPGKQTLILADEIESVTEPGVAGKIIASTADYFIKKGCFLVIATHLGHEIQKNLPGNTRIDGIEAKGLNEYYELIVDHNPVLGRLARSTPELIIEKMANSEKTEYLKFLFARIRI